MFSSNQILEISGDLSHTNELYNALKFALEVSGKIESFTRTDNPAKCIYQITHDGRYCLGWAEEKVEAGWKEFNFNFDLDVISQIISKHLSEQEIEEDCWDGRYSKGFIMKVIPKSTGSVCNGIKSPFYGIVEFEPYACLYKYFYSK